MKYHCKYDELVDPNTLIPHVKNRNKHTKEQIERLAKILEYQGWRYPIKVSNLSKMVTTGHGRMAAGIYLNCKVPVVYQDYDDPEMEYKDLIADNAISDWSELDLSGINDDILTLGPFDVDLLGIHNFKVCPSEKNKRQKECPECGHVW